MFARIYFSEQLLIIFIISTLTTKVYAVTIHCTELYSYSFYASTGEVFVCHDESSSLIVNEPDLLINEILHANGSNFEHLKQIDYLLIEDAPRLQLIPSGVKLKFENLKAIHFENCGISYVDKFNLQQFGDDLVKLDLVGNSLTFLPADLFEFTENLKYIRFSGNPLKFIESEFFTHLNAMRSVEVVEMNSCGCIDQKLVTSIYSDLASNFSWHAEKCSDFWVENFIRRRTEKRLSIVEAKMKSIEEKFIEIAALLEHQMSDRLQSMEKNLETAIKSVIHK